MRLFLSHYFSLDLLGTGLDLIPFSIYFPFCLGLLFTELFLELFALFSVDNYFSPPYNYFIITFLFL